MAQVRVTADFELSADHLWERIGKIDGLADWHPGFRSCTVEGSGVGAKRTSVIPSGDELVEKITEIDDAGRSYSYTMIDSHVNFGSFQATLRAFDRGEGKSSAEWVADFTVLPGGERSEEEVVEVLGFVFQEGFDSLKAATAPA
jgi:hypothetical protein